MDMKFLRKKHRGVNETAASRGFLQAVSLRKGRYTSLKMRSRALFCECRQAGLVIS